MDFENAGADDRQFALNNYLFYTLSDKLAVGGRAEWWKSGNSSSVCGNLNGDDVVIRSLLLLFVFTSAAVVADDWPQWMGSRRDNVWRESGIVRTFPDGGPQVLWRTPIAGGFAGLVMAYGVAELVTRFVMPASVSPFIVVCAIGLSIVVGVVSGVVPAFRASRLHVIDALRYE